jgi:hypothetical protein
VPIRTLDHYPPQDRQAIAFDLAACVIALALLLLAAADFSGSLRLLLTLAFTFYVPGRALVTNWPRMARWSPLGMSIVFSLGILTLLATATLWAGLWHPMWLFAAEAVISLAALAAALVRRYGAGATTPAAVRRGGPPTSAEPWDHPAATRPFSPVTLHAPSRHIKRPNSSH